MFVMLKYKKKKNTNYMRQIRIVYLLVIAQCIKAIGCTT